MKEGRKKRNMIKGPTETQKNEREIKKTTTKE